MKLTKIVTMYQNKKTGKEYELIPELMMGDKVCLRDNATGEDKFYAPSTLKKNFFSRQVEVELDRIRDTELQPGLRANLIRNKVKGEGVIINETNSYIGISYGKKSVAQIAFNKKRLTVSVNSEEFFCFLQGFEETHKAMELAEQCFHKIAPAKYGWRMDCEIDVTDLNNDDIVIIVEAAIESRKALVG